MRYVSVLKKYGEHARKMTKESLYEEAGSPFFLKSNSVTRIISKMMRDKNRVEEIQRDDELSYLLSDLEEIHKEKMHA